jgi:hypothetical protein
MSKIADKLNAAPATDKRNIKRGPDAQCYGIYEPDLEDAAAIQEFRRQEHPTGREYEWDGNVGWLHPHRAARGTPQDVGRVHLDSGLDPDEVEVVEPVQVRGWDMPPCHRRSGHVVRMHYYRLTVRRRNLKRDLDELVKAAKRRPQTSPTQGCTQPPTRRSSWRSATCSSARWTATASKAPSPVPRHHRRPSSGTSASPRAAPIYLIHLGDCIEGIRLQGGANTWRTTLTTHRAGPALPAPTHRAGQGVRWRRARARRRRHPRQPRRSAPAAPHLRRLVGHRRRLRRT